MNFFSSISFCLLGDNELAQRLRNELDLADKLDHELINQLTAVTQQQAQPKGTQQDLESSTSPMKEAEISTRLQVKKSYS